MLVTKKQSKLFTKNLVKTYNDRKVVNDLSFEINQGEIVALLGPNGAGKTTSFDIVVGLVQADSGQVCFDDININRLKIHERSKIGISYLTQEASAFRNLSVWDNLALVLEINRVPEPERSQRISQILFDFNIDHLKDTPAISLSGGERRRLEIARALIVNPKFILLDEPFTGIDPIAIADIQKLIHDLCKMRGIGLLITDHNPAATLSITDRAYIVQDGRVIRSGTAFEIANDELVRKHYLGENFRL